MRVRFRADSSVFCVWVAVVLRVTIFLVCKGPIGLRAGGLYSDVWVQKLLMRVRIVVVQKLKKVLRL